MKSEMATVYQEVLDLQLVPIYWTITEAGLEELKKELHPNQYQSIVEYGTLPFTYGSHLWQDDVIVVEGEYPEAVLYVDGMKL